MAQRGSEADPAVTRDQAPSSVVNNGGLTAAAAAADTVVADTGALAAGTYAVEFQGGILGALTAGVGLVAEHRNAANAANIAILGGGPQFDRRVARVTVALNERIRIKVDAVALPASTKAVAAIRVYLLP
jgi:hypothetical protein